MDPPNHWARQAWGGREARGERIPSLPSSSHSLRACLQWMGPEPPPGVVKLTREASRKRPPYAQGPDDHLAGHLLPEEGTGHMPGVECPKCEAFGISLSHAWVFRKYFFGRNSACLNHSSLFEVNS